MNHEKGSDDKLGKPLHGLVSGGKDGEGAAIDQDLRQPHLLHYGQQGLEPTCGGA